LKLEENEIFSGATKAHGFSGSPKLLLPARGGVRTVSPVENRRYVGPTNRQDVAVKVLRHQSLLH
jgi:hypothetical protein